MLQFDLSNDRSPIQQTTFHYSDLVFHVHKIQQWVRDRVSNGRLCELKFVSLGEKCSYSGSI